MVQNGPRAGIRPFLLGRGRETLLPRRVISCLVLYSGDRGGEISDGYVFRRGWTGTEVKKTTKRKGK